MGPKAPRLTGDVNPFGDFGIDIYRIAEALGKPQKSKDGWMCCCPAHDDKNPSLSIRMRDGRILLYCFAGCKFTDIIYEIRERGLLVTDSCNTPPKSCYGTPNFSYNSVTRKRDDGVTATVTGSVTDSSSLALRDNYHIESNEENILLKNSLQEDIFSDTLLSSNSVTNISVDKLLNNTVTDISVTEVTNISTTDVTYIPTTEVTEISTISVTNIPKKNNLVTEITNINEVTYISNIPVTDIINSNITIDSSDFKKNLTTVPYAPIKKQVVEDNLSKELFKKDQETLDNIKSIWDYGINVTETLGEIYLNTRGIFIENIIDKINSCIRFNKSVFHPFLKEKMPCLLSKIVDKENNFVGIQNIYLDNQGNRISKDQRSKITRGKIKGNYFAIGEFQERMIISEGVEDAVFLATRCPERSVLASLGTSTSIALPEVVKEVIIAADADVAGRKHASRLKRYLQDSGKSVNIIYPPTCKDFNDYYLEKEDIKIKEQRNNKILDLINNIRLEISNTFSMYTDFNFITKNQVANSDFLIDSILPRVGVSILLGHPKIGKSWIAQGWITDILLGKKVFETFDTNKVGVLFYALEDNASRLKTRFSKLNPALYFDENMFDVITHCSSLDQGELNRLREYLESHPHIRFIVIDPFEKIRPNGTTGKSANAYQTDYRDISLLKEIAEEFEISILLVHHLKKETTGDSIRDVNGSIGMTASVDAIFMLTKKDEIYTFDKKGKDIDAETFRMEFDYESGRFLIAEDLQEEKVNLQNKILEYIKLSQSIVSNACLYRSLGKTSEAGKVQVRRALKYLTDKKEIDRVDNGVYKISENSVIINDWWNN